MLVKLQLIAETSSWKGCKQPALPAKQPTGSLQDLTQQKARAGRAEPSPATALSAHSRTTILGILRKLTYDQATCLNWKQNPQTHSSNPHKSRGALGAEPSLTRVTQTPELAPTSLTAARGGNVNVH